ncbi:MAG: hypothetical protein JWM49_2507 [Microbacteriaceae bacterium]|nr:hypothetical protein [Microbacteriaceae bacterium]
MLAAPLPWTRPDPRDSCLDAPLELVREWRQANATAGSRHHVVKEVLEAHLAAFEPPVADEHPVILDALKSPDEWWATVVQALR